MADSAPVTEPTAPGDLPAQDSAPAAVAAPAEETTRLKVEGLEESDRTAIVDLPAGYESLLDRSKTWEDLKLPQSLLEAVRAEHWDAPSKIQASSIPICMSDGRPNLVGQAIGGSGKTGAFALVSLMKLDLSINAPQVIVMEPTRLLASQQAAVIQSLASRMPGVKVRYIVGGDRSPEMDIRAPLTEHVIVGTDGKLAEVIRKGFINPATVHTYVLDEADELLTTSRKPTVMSTSLKLVGTGNVQVLLFSASFNCMDASAPRDVKEMVNALLKARRTEKITVKASELMNPNLHHFDVVIESSTDDPSIRPQTFGAKVAYLSEVLGQCSGLKTIIFVEENKTAWALQDALKNAQFSVNTCVIAGENRQGQKTETEVNVSLLREFNKGTYNVCIATDALGRGIDIPGLNVVVNFNMPYDRNTRGPRKEHFQHRCARVGRLRQGKSGSGVCIHMVETATELRLFNDLKSHFGFGSKQLPQDPGAAAEAIDAAARAVASVAVSQTVTTADWSGHADAGVYSGAAGGPGGGGHRHPHGPRGHGGPPGAGAAPGGGYPAGPGPMGYPQGGGYPMGPGPVGPYPPAPGFNPYGPGPAGGMYPHGGPGGYGPGPMGPGGPGFAPMPPGGPVPFNPGGYAPMGPGGPGPMPQGPPQGAPGQFQFGGGAPAGGFVFGGQR